MIGYETAKHSDPLSVVFFGTGTLGVATFGALILKRMPVRLVVTAPDRPAGRGLKLKASAIKEAASQFDIPVIQPTDVNDPYTVAQISDAKCRLGLIIAYGQKIGANLIKAFPKGIINLHASFLPKYRGAAPINWAIINGERETGLTVMRIDENIDTGVMLAQRRVKIDPLERADELHDRLAKLGPELVLDVIDKIQTGTSVAIPQNAAEATRAPKLKKTQSGTDWRLESETLANAIRGLWPWPAVKSWYQPGRGPAVLVSLARARGAKSPPAAEPGTILPDFTIACGSGRLELLEVQPAGGRLMSWQQFINGRHVQPGESFRNYEVAEQ